MPEIRTRFAPSPTGLMHLGNARTALFSALLGDSFLLRIEDTDVERNRREFVDELLGDLRWLGLSWDLGPVSGEPDEHWFQSGRAAIYQEYYNQLEMEARAYPCFCTPTELEISRKVQLASGRPPRYGGKCSQLTPEEVMAKRQQGLSDTLRFRVPRQMHVEFEDGVRGAQQFATDDIGDFIIRRADGSAAFFFCNAIDDALMGVNLVMRGEDHLTNTPRQILILQALGLPIPRYAHGSLILGDDGAPLSKRNGSRSINEMREQGYFPMALLNMMGRLGHHYESDELMAWPELKSRFSLSHLGRSPARFDPVHLDHWQGLAMRAVGDDELDAWLLAETRDIVPIAQRDMFRDIVRSNCMFPVQADEWARVLFTDERRLHEDARQAAFGAGESFFLAALDAANTAGADFGGFMAQLKAATGAKGKSLFMPLRAALTGRHDGPELGLLYRIIDAHRLHRRLAEFTSMAE